MEQVPIMTTINAVFQKFCIMLLAYLKNFSSCFVSMGTYFIINVVNEQRWLWYLTKLSCEQPHPSPLLFKWFAAKTTLESKTICSSPPAHCALIWRWGRLSLVLQSHQCQSKTTPFFTRTRPSTTYDRDAGKLRVQLVRGCLLTYTACYELPNETTNPKWNS